jgi:hypothetical protein
MEIIEEQKYRFDHIERHRKSGENFYVYTAVPRPGVKIPRDEREIQLTADQLPRDTPFIKQSTSIEDEEDYGSEAQDKVPEIVIMHARDSSRDSDGAGSRRTSAARQDLLNILSTLC